MAEKNDVELGRLEKVKLRDFWRDEAKDFTPWLAKEENLKVLSETLGMDLEPKETEAAVGSYRADIVCRDIGSDSLVLIENQLGKTDHSHLGQLMTYAAGLNAATAVWIAAHFTDEHRAAMDWLNEISSDDSNFFGLEIELWKIGGSPSAPKFNIAAKPNNWSRAIKKDARQSARNEPSGVNALQFKYWTSFKDYLAGCDGFSLSPQAPRAQHWYSFSIGRSGYSLNARVKVPANILTVDLYVNNDPNGVCVDQLLEEKDEIEKIIGKKLEWAKLLNKTASRVILEKHNMDIKDSGNWPDQFQWFENTLRRFEEAFRERVKNLDPTLSADE